jgi:integrase
MRREILVNRKIRLREKGSNPRMWKVSQRLVAMLNALPKDSSKVFCDSSIDSMKSMLLKSRNKLASKLQNPRLLRISFHTLRHWKATTLYHQTKDPYYVKNFLGDKSIQNTLIYTQLLNFENEEYHSETAKH